MPQVRVAETSEESQGLEEAVEGKEAEAEASRRDLEWERDDRRREREEWDETEAGLKSDLARCKAEIKSLTAQVESLKGEREILEMERDQSVEERGRMEAILESFHEQDTLSSSLELDKARREAKAAREELSDRDAKVISLTNRLEALMLVEEEARNLRNQVDRLGSECAMGQRMRCGSPQP